RLPGTPGPEIPTTGTEPRLDAGRERAGRPRLCDLPAGERLVMRILVVTNLYPNPFDPNRGMFNRQQLRAVADRHPVRVISPVAWGDELAARRRGVPSPPAGGRKDCDGIPVEYPRYLYTPKVLRGSYGRFYRRSIRGAFARALAEFRPDVVYSPWAYPDGWAT